MTATIIEGDCRGVMDAWNDASFDAIVTDPPYHLTANKKGGAGVASPNVNSPAGRSRIGTGFMGKAWDGGDVAFQPETWAAALRVAKPGARLLAFGGPRTFHRLACAIEDAGWTLEDTIGWFFGSGFPKHKSKLKPAWEPIIVARRPAKVATPLNIDACRIPFASVADEAESKNKNQHTRYENPNSNRDSYSGSMPPRTDYDAPGRWPANAAFDGEAAALLGESSRFFYCAKASRADRNAGLDESFAKKPLNWSSGDQSPGTFQSDGTDKNARNHHPTVKPFALMAWLCRLVTPPGGHILDPFAGSGSTGRAALSEGFSFTGIELDPEYAAIARARCASIPTAEASPFDAVAE